MAPGPASKRLVAIAATPPSWWVDWVVRIAVLFIFALSSAWSLFLSILNVIPTKTANYIMNTSQFDDGELWQLAETDFTLMMTSALGMGAISMIYLYLCVLVIRRPPQSSSSHGKMKRLRDSATKSAASLVPRVWIPLASQVGSFYYEMVTHHGLNRKSWNLVMEIPEITFQTITLHNMLGQGAAPWLVEAYVALMVVNCVYCFYHITIAWKKHAFHEMVGDALLDVVFAIGVPALTLARAVLDFHGNLEVMAIRQQYFPAQVYERRGLLYADPAEVNAFATSFGSLRISNGVDLVVSVGFNLLTCLRWRRIVTIVQRQHSHSFASQHHPVTAQASSIAPSPPPTKPPADDALIETEPTDAIVDQKQGASRNADPVTARAAMVVIPHRVIPASVGLLFLAYGAMTALVASMATSSSASACTLINNCPLHAHVWFPLAPSMACPCLVYIEGKVTDRPQPGMPLLDATPGLSQAAEAGFLRTIQIVNRGLYGSLPRFVMECRELRQLIIVNCGFSELPNGWTSTFAKLEYLHISGKANQLNLYDLPVDLFSSMRSLRTLYLDHHAFLTTLPSFQGLHRLEMLYLGDTRISRLPSFNDTPSLRTLALIDNQALVALPDLTPLAKSLQAVHIKSTPLCCSGFLSHGECNLTNPSCFPFSVYDDQHSCYPSVLDTEWANSLRIGSDRFPLISNTSLAVLQPFLDSDQACNKSEAPISRKPPYESLDQCQGVYYRKCPEGICYSYDVGMVTCVNDTQVIEMRKEEIRADALCDPKEEAWLECVSR